MIRRLRNWIKLTKYIRKHRKQGRSQFDLLTSGTEVIVYPRDKTDDFEALRLPYNG